MIDSKLIKISQFGKSNWDRFSAIYSPSLNYSSFYLDYLTITYDVVNLSQVVLINETPVGLVPVFLQVSNLLSSGSLPPAPVPYRIPIAESAKFEWSKLNTLLVGHSFEKSSWITDWSGIFPHARQSLEFSNLVLNLKEFDELKYQSISRNHKRTILKSISMGQVTLIIDSSSTKEDQDYYFSQYRSAHQVAAGRQTRNNQSFNHMLEGIRNGNAKLFVALNERRLLSFLYCDFNRQFARGWSQANRSDLQPGEFPRAQLEFDAIVHFKKMGINAYHIGTRVLDPSNLTEKEKNINEFKLKFHPTEIKASMIKFGD